MYEASIESSYLDIFQAKVPKIFEVQPPWLDYLLFWMQTELIQTCNLKTLPKIPKINSNKFLLTKTETINL